jgi:predicted ribosomally synthesized peptide with SipW-like signal peptide
MNQPTRILLAVFAVGLLAGLVGVLTFAFFTDTATNPTNVFSTGKVDISNSQEGTAIVAATGMAPGDKVTQPLTVSNIGSLQLHYYVTSMADNTDGKALRAQLDLTIKTGVATCTNAGFGLSGTVIYGPGDLGADPAITVIGNPLPGWQTGDRVLNASPASEVLCFQVELPSSTGNTYQDATTTAEFTFYAEQRANNP